jgi:uncharacterized protein (TIGR02147 family)
MEWRMSRPNIYDYLDYRSYLSDLYHFFKAETSHFSYRYFSKKAGFASPNFLQLVINGRRNLTNTSIAQVAKGFSLKKKEREFFEYLVFMNQATVHDEKDHYYCKMMSMCGSKNIRTLAKDQYEYFSKWYYPAIREMLSFGADAATPEQIAAKLNPKISVSRVGLALRLLERLQLIVHRPDGRWEQVHRDISTGPEIKSLAVAKFHKEMLQLASESIDRFNGSQRDISALTLSIEHENLTELKARLVSFRRELMTLAGGDENPDMVVQINFQLFPLTK